MIFTFGRHIQVLMETPESIAKRERRPRCRPKYALSCTCSQARKPNGHCIHTLALCEANIDPKRWRDVVLCEMSAKEHPFLVERPRIELEREVLTLRQRVAELEGVAA